MAGVLSHVKGRGPEGLPPFVVLPTPIGNTGVTVSHGQGAGYLGAKHEPFSYTAIPPVYNRAGSCSTLWTTPSASLRRTWRAVRRRRRSTRYSPRRQREHSTFMPRRDEVRRLWPLRWAQHVCQSCLLAERLVDAWRAVGDGQYVRAQCSTKSPGIATPTAVSLAVTSQRLQRKRCARCSTLPTLLSWKISPSAECSTTTLVLAMDEFGRTPPAESARRPRSLPGVWSVLFLPAPVYAAVR